MIGIIAINNFPFYPNALFQLKNMCEKVIVRLDPKSPLEIDLDGVEVFRGTKAWNKWNWRQELIDRVPPTDLVVNLDEDETFSEGIEQEIKKFTLTNKKVMMFHYTMETENNRKVEIYPSLAHCKVFRWQEGLTYNPYAGLCLPTEYANTRQDMKGMEFESVINVRHWCFYTKKMELKKVRA